MASLIAILIDYSEDPWNNSLLHEGLKYHVKELELIPLSVEKIKEGVMKYKPDIVIIPSVTFTLNKTEEIMNTLRKELMTLTKSSLILVGIPVDFKYVNRIDMPPQKVILKSGNIRLTIFCVNFNREVFEEKGYMVKSLSEVNITASSNVNVFLTSNKQLVSNVKEVFFSILLNSHMSLKHKMSALIVLLKFAKILLSSTQIIKKVDDILNEALHKGKVDILNDLKVIYHEYIVLGKEIDESYATRVNSIIDKFKSLGVDLTPFIGSYHENFIEFLKSLLRTFSHSKWVLYVRT